MYIEPGKDLKDAVDKAAEEFSKDAMATPEEGNLIYNAMTRALQVTLRHQAEHVRS